MSAISRVVTVACDPEAAFAVFTERIGEWWPLPTHSISNERHGAPAVGVAIEPRVGGRLFETAPTGEEHPWGEVRVWEPPHRLAYSWVVGRDDDLATEVEITFTAVEGGTRVTVEHSGWEIWAERTDEVRASYDDGWGTVLGAYAEAT
jgi:uncharacterized protein YndB with AHSA1/START domain